MKRIQDLVSRGDIDAAGDVWMDAIEDMPPPGAVGDVLTAIVAAGREELAETLGWSLLEACEGAAAEDRLALARAALLAVPGSGELRRQTADLYRVVHGHREHFDTIWRTAGLDRKQPPARALRTLDLCLSLQPGDWMGDPFADRVIRIERLSPVGYFEYTENGERSDIEPKELADTFETLAADDVRFLLREDPDGLREMVEHDIPGLLAGIAGAKGGRCDVDVLKDILVPRFLEQERWSKWWGRARNAVKKSPHLTIEGRNPGTVAYHADGISLEEEFAAARAAARAPGELLDVLRQYVSTAQKRGAAPDDSFTGGIGAALAREASRRVARGSTDALAALLAVAEAARLGCPAPADELPAPDQLLAEADDPAGQVAAVTDKSHRDAALALLKSHPGAADQLERLLYRAPLDFVEAVAAALAARGAGQAVHAAVEKAVADPAAHVDLCAWAWIGSAAGLFPAPDRLNLLLKLLELLRDVDHDPGLKAGRKKDIRAVVRAAFSADDFARYAETLDGIDEQMAAVVKNGIERTEGLALTVHDRMIDILSGKFYALFRKQKVLPWEDEKAIWTTEAALREQEQQLRELKEVAMPANAKRIGEAASFGDLSENAEWQAAIEERDMLVARARALGAELAMAKIIGPEDVPADTVGIGSQVTLKHTADGRTVVLAFLGPWDSDPDNRIYAYRTPLAQSLMGSALGDTLSLTIDGVAGEYEIVAIESALSPR